jgi:ribonucleotide reductase alpha subunit
MKKNAKQAIMHNKSNSTPQMNNHQKDVKNSTSSSGVGIKDKNEIKKSKNEPEKKHTYDAEFIKRHKVTRFGSVKKIAREMFNNKLRVTKSFLVKFINYYIYKSQYSYMKNDSRFDIKYIIDDLMKKLPTNTEIDRLEFYDYAADYFMQKSSIHMVYKDIASMIMVHKIHKTTSPSIKHVVQKLYGNVDIHGKDSPLISDEYYRIVMKHNRKIQNKIVMSRDYLFDYFGAKTLLRSYLKGFHRGETKKIIERPQHLIMRVAIGIHGYDLDAAFETYDYISQRYFTHATPTLFNAGTRYSQMSSCYLNGVDDSLESIKDALGDMMSISKWAGGIGIHLNKIRARGSLIRGTNGQSSGIVPLCRTINEIARYINQGGKRNGSIAAYLSPWHADIFEFVELRSIKGSDTLRARDLFLALWISDLFMERVRDNEMWSLMCPDTCKGLDDVYGEEFRRLYMHYENEGMYVKQVSAVELFKHIMEMQIETGFPYFLYKDQANEKSNQKNLGTIKSSNLCVSGDTHVLTKMGSFEIKTLEGKNVDIWNGFEYSNVKVTKTGQNQDLSSVVFSNGETLKCTKYHKFYVEINGKIKELRTYELQEGMKIIKYRLPVINFGDDHETGIGYNEGYNEDSETVPYNCCLSLKMRWLSGFIDRDTHKLVKIGANKYHMCFRHGKKSFLRDIKRLLNTVGTDCKISDDVATGEHMLLVSCSDLIKLTEHGLSPKNVSIKGDSEESSLGNIFVRSVKSKIERGDTFCFTEPKRHYGVFNGILTGQCAEIIEYSDANETAVCNLASVCLPRFLEDINGEKRFNFEKLGRIVRVCVKNLNRIIDRNFYPTPKTKLSNMRHRPMGIGVQGLADLYNMMGLPFDSKRARLLNKRIFETIYYYSLDQSKECAKVHGRPYDTFFGSPASKGILQYHMWGLSEKDLSDRYDWNRLIEEIKEHGLRNSLLIALMPTASTSQIMGNSECIEPYMSNIFVRTTLAGNFIVINKTLMKNLDDLGLWTDDIRKKLLIYNGSVQKIKEIPDYLKKIYKTAFEINPRAVIMQSAERGPFICQSQSLNLFIAKPSFDLLFNTLYLGWRKGLKTGMYYYRTVPAVDPIQFGIDVDDVKRLTGDDSLVDRLINESARKENKKEFMMDEKTGYENVMSQVVEVKPREIEECLVCGS